MKLILLFGCIILASVGITTVRATAEQCNAMFKAIVEMRGNLTEFLEGDQEKVQKLKKFAVYWTNVNVDDDVQLRQMVCQVVNANSIDEMAAALRVPRTYFSHMYMGLKSNALRYKMGVEEMLLLLPSEALSDRRRQAMRAFVNVMNVAESVGLHRFNAPPSRDPEPPGCHTMMQRGLRVYNDRHMFFRTGMEQQTNERFRVGTGIDIDDRDHISAVLCKLGEVSDLTELAAVFNQPVSLVRELYPKIVPHIRHFERMIAAGRIPSAIPEHVPQNMLSLLRGMQEVGLLDLTD